MYEAHRTQTHLVMSKALGGHVLENQLGRLRPVADLPARKWTTNSPNQQGMIEVTFQGRKLSPSSMLFQSFNVSVGVPYHPWQEWQDQEVPMLWVPERELRCPRGPEQKQRQSPANHQSYLDPRSSLRSRYP